MCVNTGSQGNTPFTNGYRTAIFNQVFRYKGTDL